MSNISDIISQLEAYDVAYEQGVPLVPDVQYDTMKREAQKAAPGHAYFMRVGADVRGDKVKLPFTMGSLDQIYEGDYIKWCIKYALRNSYLYISHKLDGVSCMLQYKNGQLQVAYSRGDGTNGQDITRHVKKVKNVPLTIQEQGHITIRGELIMSNGKFDNNWAGTFANPRNMVAGLFNRKDTDEEAIADVDFVAYQIVDGGDGLITRHQSTDMVKLSGLGFQTVEYQMVLGQDITDDVLTDMLAKARFDSAYELDGLVLTIDDKDHHKTLSSSSSLNPEHSVKYKVLGEDAKVDTKVVKVHWELSKHGFYKPRVEIQPVALMGVTITFATGFNGKYISENNIGPGTDLKITRSGQVIPYILQVNKGTVADMPTEDWEWNENKVEIVAKDFDKNPDVIFKQVLDFFETLEVDLLKEASLEKVINFLHLRGAAYETTIETILSLIELEWVNIIGSNGSKIFASLQRRLDNLTVAKYLGAVKFFGMGFGVRKAKMLLKNLADDDDVWGLSAAEIASFEGFDTKTAKAFANGLQAAEAFSVDLGLVFIKEVKTNELAHLNVVFTGFRDKEFQDKLEKSGAKVGSSVSKKTTHLITAEPNSQSSKAKKAREMGVETLSLEEFKDKYKL